MHEKAFGFNIICLWYIWPTCGCMSISWQIKMYWNERNDWWKLIYLYILWMILAKWMGGEGMEREWRTWGREVELVTSDSIYAFLSLILSFIHEYYHSTISNSKTLFGCTFVRPFVRLSVCSFVNSLDGSMGESVSQQDVSRYRHVVGGLTWALDMIHVVIV